MKNQSNLISIIINCFNGEKYLSKTIESILKQKYNNYEVIFIDNCSTDNSKKFLKRLEIVDLNILKQKKKSNYMKLEILH